MHLPPTEYTWTFLLQKGAYLHHSLQKGVSAQTGYMLPEGRASVSDVSSPCKMGWMVIMSRKVASHSKWSIKTAVCDGDQLHDRTADSTLLPRPSQAHRPDCGVGVNLRGFRPCISLLVHIDDSCCEMGGSLLVGSYRFRHVSGPRWLPSA